MWSISIIFVLIHINIVFIHANAYPMFYACSSTSVDNSLLAHIALDFNHSLFTILCLSKDKTCFCYGNVMKFIYLLLACKYDNFHMCKTIWYKLTHWIHTERDMTEDKEMHVITGFTHSSFSKNFFIYIVYRLYLFHCGLSCVLLWLESSMLSYLPLFSWSHQISSQNKSVVTCFQQLVIHAWLYQCLYLRCVLWWYYELFWQYLIFLLQT